MKLSKTETAWFRAIQDALVPPGKSERFPASANEAGAEGVFAEMLAYLPGTTAAGLRASVVFIEALGPFLGLGRAGRFSRLGAGEQEDCLAGLSKSDIYLVRQMVMLQKTVACFAWGADKRVRDAAGMNEPPRFTGPWEDRQDG